MTDFDFYTFAETLRVLGISEGKLNGAVTDGYIRAYREGTQMVFKKAEVHKIKEKGFDDEPRRVHALHSGQPLCGFTTDAPRDWPPGHAWDYPSNSAAITCSECKKKATAGSIRLTMDLGRIMDLS